VREKRKNREIKRKKKDETQENREISRGKVDLTRHKRKKKKVKTTKKVSKSSPLYC